MFSHLDQHRLQTFHGGNQGFQGIEFGSQWQGVDEESDHLFRTWE